MPVRTTVLFFNSYEFIMCVIYKFLIYIWTSTAKLPGDLFIVLKFLSMLTVFQVYMSYCLLVLPENEVSI